MNYWLAKTEPHDYSWDDFMKDKEVAWTGIKNYQARNYLNEMQLKDLVLIYHSGKERAVIGLAEVTEESFPDPTDKKWMAVRLQVKQQLKRPVLLSDIKKEDLLSEMRMLKQPRLSLSPMSKDEFDVIMKMGS